MSIHQWAIRWGVHAAALQDLQHHLGTLTPNVELPKEAQGKHEAWVQSVARVEASRDGIKTFRNNVGALKDKTGRLVRYGLANDSEKLNELIKSSDLIGWRPLLVIPEMVGTKVAQFWCRECKEPGWQYTGADREPAQLAWINMVNADGGDAAFLCDPRRI